MHAHDEPQLDERPLRVFETRVVIKDIYDVLDADRRRSVRKLTPEQTKRAWYVVDVLSWSESGGRSNPTIELADPWRVGDVERVLGVGDSDDAPSPNARWKKVTRQFEQQSSAAGGRTI